jgi:CBS domain-containing protein
MAKTAADIMNTDVPALEPHDDARKAIESLAKLELGALPVVNSEQKVIGIVSESDLILSDEESDLHLPHYLNIMGGVIFTGSMKGFESRLNKAFATNVRDLMTPDPFCAELNDGVEKVARVIAEKHHNHLPVVDNDGKLAGVVTRADVLAALVDEG